MVVLPVALAIVAHQAAIGAGQGAAFGAFTGAVGGAITCAQSDGSKRDILLSAMHLGAKGALVGAASGFAFGAVGGTFKVATGLGKCASLAKNYQSLPKAVQPESYVYAIENASKGLHKIGRTINPALRLPQIQRQTANSVKYACISSTKNAPELEKALHGMFASSRVTGEWHRLSVRQMANLVKRMQKL